MESEVGMLCESQGGIWELLLKYSARLDHCLNKLRIDGGFPVGPHTFSSSSENTELEEKYGNQRVS